jgi:hypothetical protein
LMHNIFEKVKIKKTEKGYALAPYKIKRLNVLYPTLKNDVIGFNDWVEFSNKLGIPSYLEEDSFYSN